MARHEGRDCSGGKNCPAWRCGPGLCLVESVTKREGHEPKLLAGKTVRETAAGWGPLRRVGRGMVMCHDSTVMLSWGVNILSADPRCESGERRGFTHLTKIVTCRVLEAVT